MDAQVASIGRSLLDTVIFRRPPRRDRPNSNPLSVIDCELRLRGFAVRPVQRTHQETGNEEVDREVGSVSSTHHERTHSPKRRRSPGATGPKLAKPTIRARLTGILPLAALIGLTCAGLTGCTTPLSVVERAAIGFSLIRSPVTLRTLEPNTCLEPVQRSSLDRVAAAIAKGVPREEAVRLHFDSTVDDPQCRRPLLGDVVTDRVDDHADVADAETIVVVAISGGGARAARLAAHALAQLEARYNAYAEANPETNLRPFGCLVDAYSTVSGGSIYVSYVAWHFASASDGVGDGCVRTDREAQVRQLFHRASDDPFPRWGQQNLGPVSGFAYLSPFTFFLLPAMTLITDRSFLDVLAHGVNLTHQRYFEETMLGELPQRPRFFFNSVAVETGVPFVMTQRIQHFPSDFRPTWTARIDLPHRRPMDPARPLNGLTLEDLNSSPALFPLPYATMASAAFPPVMEPLQLRHFGVAADQTVFPSERSIHLTDGGVFDNSGLHTAVDFFEHLVRGAPARDGEGQKQRRLILLSINAETSRSLDNKRSIELLKETPWGIGFNWPIRSLGANAIDQIHFSNKRRGEEIAWARLISLKEEMASEVDVETLYFPVNLTQLSALDPYAIEGGEEIFAKVTEIPTAYTIGSSHDDLLAEAVHRILSAEQSGAGWKIDPDGEAVLRLDDAFVQALARAQREAEGPDVERD